MITAEQTKIGNFQPKTEVIHQPVKMSREAKNPGHYNDNKADIFPEIQRLGYQQGLDTVKNCRRNCCATFQQAASATGDDDDDRFGLVGRLLYLNSNISTQPGTSSIVSHKGSSTASSSIHTWCGRPKTSFLARRPAST